MGEHAIDSEVTERLLEEARKGDRGAFELLFGMHRAYLLQFVERRLGPKVRARIDASDVVQEAQAEAFFRLKDFLTRRPVPFRFWLRQTAYERLVKLRRRHVGAARRNVEREAP